MTDLFTDDQIETLRAEFAGINRIDPCLPTYAGIIALLNKMPVAQLEQVRDARIKFLSRLAINRIPA